MIAYTTAVEGGVPRHARREMTVDHQMLVYDVLTLPLASATNPAEIAMLLVVMIPVERNPAVG